ncbi:hypothetical protein N9X34_02305 [Alphaproteobacteria bacterium]|nr:hypothetical protein [Alphaproteobacteria bacterium]
MKKLIILSIIILFPLKAFAVCNADTTFDATVSVDIPKPKGFFSGTPKPSPEVIAEGISKAKQSVLQKFISKCVTERNKLDQYLKVKESIDSQTDNFVNVTKSKQNQKELILNVKVRATVNSKLFESLLYSGNNTANNSNSGKKRKRMVSFFIARKAESTDTKIYDDKIAKIKKAEKGMAAEKSATTDGTTSVVNKQASAYKKTVTGGSREVKQRSSERSWVIMPSSDLNNNIAKTLSDNGFRGIRYPSFAKRCGAPPSDIIEEEFSTLDKLTDDTEAEIFDAIAENDRCNRSIGFVAIGTINVNTALVDKVSGNFTVSASIRVDVSQIIDGFPEVVASIGPVQVRSQGLEDNEAEKNALIKAGEKAAQEIVNSLKAQGI